jgi:hypothetical protein
MSAFPSKSTIKRQQRDLREAQAIAKLDRDNAALAEERQLHGCIHYEIVDKLTELGIDPIALAEYIKGMP